MRSSVECRVSGWSSPSRASTGPESHLEPDDRLGETAGVLEGMSKGVGELQGVGVVRSQDPATRCQGLV
jgi:hypothetical protein